MKKLVILLSLLFIALAPVHAQIQSFGIEAQDSITIAQLTARQLDITIETVDNDTFDINVLDIQPWMTLSDSRINIEAKSTGVVSLYIAPTLDLTLGRYKVTVIITNSMGEKIEHPVFINVVKGEVVDVEKILVRGDLQPTGTVSIDVYVKNFKASTQQNVRVKTSVTSTFKIADFTNTIDKIDPEEVKVITNSFKIEKYSPPGAYLVDVTIEDENMRSVKQIFRVISRPVIMETYETGSALIGSTKTIKITNNGNAISDYYAVRDNIGLPAGYFYFGEAPATRENGLFVWEIRNLKPGDTYTISYTINYLPLIALLVFIALSAWYGVFKVRTLRTRKYIMQKKDIKEGEEFTVGIEIKNSVGGKIEDIKIIDFVPPVFEIKDATHGPAPRKVKTAVGTELHWDMKDLAKREERILVYKISPIFGVSGEIRLPPARVSFVYKKKKLGNQSGFAKLGMKQRRPEQIIKE